LIYQKIGVYSQYKIGLLTDLSTMDIYILILWMKKNLIFIVTIIILIILLIAFIPAVAKWVRVNRLQKELRQYKEDYARCEIVLKESHSWANAVRAKLNEELENSFTDGTLSMPITGATPSQQMDNYLTGIIGE
jgi:ABC-type bacteriocin/lantibiotic exporter with double-glycine peptidase domain